MWRRTVHKCSVNLFWREDGEADGWMILWFDYVL